MQQIFTAAANKTVHMLATHNLFRSNKWLRDTL